MKNIIKVQFFLNKLKFRFFNALNMKNNKDDFKKIIEKFLPCNPIILEAGAHVGSDTVEMAKMWPDAIIHAFEPVPNLYKKLCKGTRNLKNVKTYNLALSDQEGELTMYVSSGLSDASSSLLKPKEHLDVHPKVFFDDRIKVQSTTIDSWAIKNKIEKIDFMWLDMQGGEYKALSSSPIILNALSCVYTEVSLMEVYENVLLYKSFKKWLEAQGFISKIEKFPNRDMGDVLFVRKK